MTTMTQAEMAEAETLAHEMDEPTNRQALTWQSVSAREDFRRDVNGIWWRV